MTLFDVFTIAALVFLDALDDVWVCQLRHFFSDSGFDSLLIFNRPEVVTLLGKDTFGILECGQGSRVTHTRLREIAGS